MLNIMFFNRRSSSFFLKREIFFLFSLTFLILSILNPQKLLAQTGSTTAALRVTLRNAQTMQAIPDTRVRLYKNGLWNTDKYTDANGLVLFDIETGPAIAYSLNTTVFNDIPEGMENITAGGDIDFLVGEVELTMRGSTWTTFYPNQKVTIRKVTGPSTSSFYRYVYSDAGGKILMNLPGLSTGEKYLLYSTAPTDNSSYSMTVEAKGAYDFFLTATPPVMGRDAFTRIEAESYDTMYGVQTEPCAEGGENIGYININDWVMYKDINFGTDGALSISARSSAQYDNGGKIEVRLGSLTGTTIATLTADHTGSWQTWSTVSGNLNGRVTGLNDLYLVFTGVTSSLLNLNWIEFSKTEAVVGPTNPTGPTDPTTDPTNPGIVTRDPYNGFEAESFDEMYGVQNESCSEGGENIGYIAGGDWVAYKNVDFGTGGALSITARVASQVSGGGSFDIRLGSTTGTIIGAFTMGYTGGWQAWESYHADLLQLLTGRQDIYLTFTGGNLNVNWIKFNVGAAPENPTPPTVPSNPGGSSSVPADPPALIPYPDFVPAIINPPVKTAPAAHSYGTVTLEKKVLSGNGVIPFTTGVPFARGILRSAHNVRLLSGNVEIPAQFEVLSNWAGGSIKSLLVITQLPANSAETLTLEYGTTVTAGPTLSKLKVSEATTDITVDTGKVQLVFAKNGPLFQSFSRDINGDGLYQTSETILKDGDIFLVNAFDRFEYLASRAVDRQLTIEENGAERVVVRLDGSLADATGDLLTKFRVRAYVYNNSELFDIDYTLIDDRPEDVQRSHDTLAFSANSYGIRWKHNLAQVDYSYGVDSSIVSGSLSAVKKSTYLLQNGDVLIEGGGYQGHTFDVTGDAAGQRADGWMSLSSANTSFNLFVKDFWQNYPNEFSADLNTVTLSLHPARVEAFDTQTPALTGTRYLRAKTFYNPAEGMAKTYQMRLQLTGRELPAAVKMSNDDFQVDGQNLKTEADWLHNSGVYGFLNRGNQDGTAGFDAHMMEAVYKMSMVEGRVSMQYGWRDYGDRMRPGYNIAKSGLMVKTFYNDTHVGANKFFRQYLRTGDDRWYELAENATRHFMDIDVSHGYRYGYWRKGTKEPAGEVRAIAHEMMDHQARNLHLGHAHLSGLSDYYLLTGDKRALDVIHEIGNWWKYMIPKFYKLPFNWDNEYFEAERDYAWPLYVLNEYVRVTNDQEYHRQVNGHLVKFLTDWWKTAKPHKLRGVVLGQNDYTRGTGWWTMTKMDNAGGTDSNGTNPWMAGPLIANLALFYEADKYIGSSVNHAELEEMLLQTTNYVVKWGYKDAIGGFVYCELTEDKGYPTDSQIIYALIYAHELFQARQAAGTLANPQWYDSQHKWAKIIKDHEIEYRTRNKNANSVSTGWYGYGFPYPLDVFKMLEKY